MASEQWVLVLLGYEAWKYNKWKCIQITGPLFKLEELIKGHKNLSVYECPAEATKI